MVTRSRRGRERQSPRRARDRRRDATSRERPRPRFITNASFRLFARRRARRRRIVSRESAPAAAVPRKRRMARGAGRGSATRAGDTHPGGVFLWLSCPSRSVNARRPRRDSRVRGRQWRTKAAAAPEAASLQRRKKIPFYESSRLFARVVDELPRLRHDGKIDASESGGSLREASLGRRAPSRRYRERG